MNIDTLTNLLNNPWVIIPVVVIVGGLTIITTIIEIKQRKQNHEYRKRNDEYRSEAEYRNSYNFHKDSIKKKTRL